MSKGLKESLKKKSQTDINKEQNYENEPNRNFGVEKYNNLNEKN